MKKLFALILVSLFMLSGCLDKADRMNNGGPTISNQTAPAPIKDALSAQADDLKKHIDSSQNAIQTNMQTLLGVSVGKVADDLLKVSSEIRDLIHAEISTKIGDIQNQMSASVASNNELRVMMTNQMTANANLQAQLSAALQLNAQLQAQLDVKINAVAAGIAGKIETTTNDLKQNMQAGRDVITSNQQFTKEVLSAIQSADKTSAWNTTVAMLTLMGIILGVCLIICWFMNSSRKNALHLADGLQGQLKEKQATLERALTLLPPESHDKVFLQGPNKPKI